MFIRLRKYQKIKIKIKKIYMIKGRTLVVNSIRTLHATSWGNSCITLKNE